MKQYIQHTFPSELSELILCDDFHVSVSKAFNVKHKTAQSLSESIDNEFKNLARFKLTIDSLDILPCDEQDENDTKHFIAFVLNNKIDSQQSNNEFKNIIKTADACLSSFKLPKYYKNPIFHLSFAHVDLSDTNFNKKKFLGKINVSWFDINKV